jgi:hypothetical protein
VGYCAASANLAIRSSAFIVVVKAVNAAPFSAADLSEVCNVVYGISMSSIEEENCGLNVEPSLPVRRSNPPATSRT